MHIHEIDECTLTKVWKSFGTKSLYVSSKASDRLLYCMSRLRIRFDNRFIENNEGINELKFDGSKNM